MTQTSTTANYCIVTKSESGAIALRRTADGYRLPVVELPNPCWLPGEISQLNSELMGTFGLNCTTLRWLRKEPNFNLVLMEWHPGSLSPEIDMEWRDPLDATVALPASQLRMVKDWQASPTDGLLPWEQPGWMRQMVMKLMQIFDGVRHPRVTNLAQFKAAWGLSSLMLIDTSNGEYFFKIGIKLGVDEYAVTQFLHRKFPRYVRDLFMVDERQGWMISQGIAQTASTGDEYADAATVFRIYGEIQLGCDEFMRSEQATGLRIRDESWLRVHLERLFSKKDCPSEFRQVVSTLTDQQRSALRENWARQIDELATSKLPLTFNQEDLNFDNVLNTDKGPVFIDWADCAKAHPFFSVHRSLNLWRLEDPEAYERGKEKVTASYLDAFSHLAEQPVLRAEFELTGQLSRLYQAFLWQERSRDQNHDSAWGSFCFAWAGKCMSKAMGLPKASAITASPDKTVRGNAL